MIKRKSQFKNGCSTEYRINVPFSSMRKNKDRETTYRTEVFMWFVVCLAMETMTPLICMPAPGKCFVSPQKRVVLKKLPLDLFGGGHVWARWWRSELALQFICHENLKKSTLDHCTLVPRNMEHISKLVIVVVRVCWKSWLLYITLLGFADSSY
jgi:hypothetical protein